MILYDLDTFKVINFTTFKFPGGEVNVKIDIDSFNTAGKQEINIIEQRRIKIVQRVNSSDDIMELLLITNALRNLFVDFLVLELPYVPYARQDRVMNGGEALSIKVFTELINSLDFKKVIIYDPHSDVTSSLINNVLVINNVGFVNTALTSIISERGNPTELFYFVSPDAGALKKVFKCAEANKKHVYDEIIIGTKHRDVVTGNITHTSINKNNLQGKSCIIIDDICDGGRTFIELAEVLKQEGAGDIYLLVTFPIFSKGMKVFGNIKRIYTTDLFRDLSAEEMDYATQVNLLNKVIY